MSESGDEDIEHLRAVGKKALWLANKQEQERSRRRELEREGVSGFFEVGASYKLVFEKTSYFPECPPEVWETSVTCEAVDGALVKFRELYT
jgi:hypothetical protein